jgi:hypothetical protein
MHTTPRVAWLFAVLSAALLAGCATPAEKSEITPKFYSSAEKNVALTVIEARPYVLSGDKTPKFEGLVRGAFGIPHTFNRPNRPPEERFVDFLAQMIRDGLADAGTNVAIVAMPNGASLDDAWKKMSETGAARYIAIRVLESNWDVGGFTFSYKYDMGVHVAGPGSFKMQAKQFSANEQNKPSGKHNVWDMHSVRYKEILESMFADPLISQALQN